MPKSLKKIFIVLAVIIAFCKLSLYGYEAHYESDHVAIRELCAKINVGEKINLNFIRSFNIRMFNWKFNPLLTPDIFKSKYKNIGEMQTDYQLLDPKYYSEVFFLAEGFHRESMTLVFDSAGTISKIKCHTNTGFFERTMAGQ